MKKMKILIILMCIAFKAFAPEYRTLFIPIAMKAQPYEAIWKAVCQVESSGNPLAWNQKENAIGISQIRAIRVKDYFQRSGNHYTHEEMFSPEKSKIVFMYYAMQYSPDQQERISREWNGGYRGMQKEQTKHYWQKVQTKLL